MRLLSKILFLVVVLTIAMELTNASPTEAYRTDGDLARFEILNEFKGTLITQLSKLLFDLRCLCVFPSVFLQNFFFVQNGSNSVNRHLEF